MSSPEPLPDAVQLGGRLRELREGLSMTQEALSRLLGVTDRTIRAWETGAWSIPSDALQNMSRQGMDVTYLLTGKHVHKRSGREAALDEALLDQVIRWVDGPWRGHQDTPMSEHERLRWIVRFYLKARSLGTSDFDQLALSDSKRRRA